MSSTNIAPTLTRTLTAPTVTRTATAKAEPTVTRTATAKANVGHFGLGNAEAQRHLVKYLDDEGDVQWMTAARAAPTAKAEPMSPQ